MKHKETDNKDNRYLILMLKFVFKFRKSVCSKISFSDNISEKKYFDSKLNR